MVAKFYSKASIGMQTDKKMTGTDALGQAAEAVKPDSKPEPHTAHRTSMVSSDIRPCRLSSTSPGRPT
jgi:hypothetical protein